VLNQALSDAFGESKRPIAECERQKAREFLLSDRSHWREERELVCSLAGIDAEALRGKVKALNEGELLSRKVISRKVSA
jgi:hypothetical protein